MVTLQSSVLGDWTDPRWGDSLDRRICTILLKDRHIYIQKIWDKEHSKVLEWKNLSIKILRQKQQKGDYTVQGVDRFPLFRFGFVNDIPRSPNPFHLPFVKPLVRIWNRGYYFYGLRKVSDKKYKKKKIYHLLYTWRPHKRALSNIVKIVTVLKIPNPVYRGSKSLGRGVSINRQWLNLYSTM